MVLAIATLVCTPVISIFTIVRCVHRWEFVLVAVWVGLTSGTAAIWTLVTVRQLDHRSRDFSALSRRIYDSMRNDTSIACCAYERENIARQALVNHFRFSKPENLNPDRYRTPVKWLTIYLVAVLIALPGILSLVVKTWSQPNVRYVTYAFTGISISYYIIEVALSVYVMLGRAIQSRKQMFLALGVKDS
jgi:hypothetical protein